MDTFTKEKRSEIMSKVKSKNTAPEIKLRKALHKRGYRYRIGHSLAGKPDIVFPSKRVLVFIDGCFWHKCPRCYRAPKSNRDYWIPKIDMNARRDRKTRSMLRKDGWTVVRIWEHQVNKSVERCVSMIERRIVNPG